MPRALYYLRSKYPDFDYLPFEEKYELAVSCTVHIKQIVGMIISIF